MTRMLIICSLANDLFISNMTRWLKARMDVSIDVLHYAENDGQQCSMEHYDNVHYLGCSHKGLKAFRHFATNKSLLKWMRGKHYDIIHCHAAIQASVLSTRLRNHCDRLCLTFWGGELETMRVIHSNAIYRCFLKRFLRKVDMVINSSSFNEKLIRRYPFLEGRTQDALFGSVALEELLELTKSETKAESKKILGIDTGKLTVMIGYSGKEIHNHISIIRCLSECDDLKDNIHILAPMTRGGTPAYVQKVESVLAESGYAYTLLQGSFLSDTDVARLRNATDITLQLSDYDGFSRSVVECMWAGSILIYGDWLDYDARLHQEGLKGIKVKEIKDIIPLIHEIKNDDKAYQAERISNRKNIPDCNLWKNCINDWVKAYTK